MSDIWNWLTSIWGNKKDPKDPKDPRGIVVNNTSNKKSKGLSSKIKDKLSK